MELLAARAARVQDDEDFAWIVAGKQDGPGQGGGTILPAAGNFSRSSPRKLFRYREAVESRACFQFVPCANRFSAAAPIPNRELSNGKHASPLSKSLFLKPNRTAARSRTTRPRPPQQLGRRQSFPRNGERRKCAAHVVAGELARQVAVFASEGDSTQKREDVARFRLAGFTQETNMGRMRLIF